MLKLAQRCAQDRALFKQMTKQNIKEEILRKLNFDTAPSWQNVSITQSPVIKNWIKKVNRDSLGIHCFCFSMPTSLFV